MIVTVTMTVMMAMVVTVSMIFVQVPGFVVVVVVPMAVTVLPVHFFEETHRVQESNAKGKKQELGQPKPEGGRFVQNVRQNIDGGEVDKTTGRDKNQTVPCQIGRLEPDNAAQHRRHRRSELSKNCFPLRESALDQNRKVPQFVGDLVEQYREGG